MVDVIYVELCFGLLLWLASLRVLVIASRLLFILQVHEIVLIIEDAVNTLEEVTAAGEDCTADCVNEATRAHLVRSGETFDYLINLVLTWILSGCFAVTGFKRGNIHPSVGTFSV